MDDDEWETVSRSLERWRLFIVLFRRVRRLQRIWYHLGQYLQTFSSSLRTGLSKHCLAIEDKKNRSAEDCACLWSNLCSDGNPRSSARDWGCHKEVQRLADENRSLHSRLTALESSHSRPAMTRSVAFGVDTRTTGKPDRFTGAAGWRDCAPTLELATQR
eukprot:1033424-Amphidinium_carterae.1